MSEIILTIQDVNPVDLLGEQDSKLNLLKKAYPDLKITSRGNSIKISGDRKHTQQAKASFERMVKTLKDEKALSKEKVRSILSGNYVIDLEEQNGVSEKAIVHGRNGKAIKARTRNQKKMVQLSEHNDILFAIGPAGTGKTYTAVALAVRALKNRMVKRIILTRPAVEAGESLGFLPGDLKDKIDPYLRPLYDALDDMFPMEKLEYFMQNRIIEIAPLAFMRGRTLNDAFIILDEAQNATSTQLKMFLTRLGPTAKCIITGDLSQIDLPRHQKSGLYTALDILTDIDGVAKVFLDAEDVVRHQLVKAIIKKYDEYGALRKAAREREANKRDES